MSRMVHMTGTLVEVDLKGKTLEKECERIIKEREQDADSSSYDTYAERVKYNYEEEYYITDDKLYEINNMQEYGEDDDIFKSVKNSDNSIDFEVKFYNGGCPLEEALETALEERNQK